MESLIEITIIFNNFNTDNENCEIGDMNLEYLVGSSFLCGA